MMRSFNFYDNYCEGSTYIKKRFALVLYFTLFSTMDGSTSRIDLQHTYRQEVVEKDVNERLSYKTTKLEMILWQFLYSVHPSSKLGHQTITIISRSVENILDWRPMHAAQAFRHIEQFALNLLDYPWRNEYKTIKLYSGFWKLKIVRHLYEPQSLFTKMGYKPNGDYILQLHTIASRDQLIEVATDCYIAAAELQFYEEINLLIDHQGFSLADVHNCRTTIPGNKQACIDWISSNCKPSFRKIQENFERKNSIENGVGRRRSSDLSTLPPPPIQQDIPSSSINIENVSASEDHDPRDSGYHSKSQSREHHSHSAKLGFDNNPDKADLFVNTGFESSISGYDSSSIAIDNEYVDEPQARTSSFEDDFYAPKTMEDHLKQSLKLVSKKSDQSSHSVEKGGFSDWDHITKGLKDKFGDDYYAGARGDILQNAITSSSGYSSAPINTSSKVAGIHKGVAKKTPTGSPLSPPQLNISCALQYQQSSCSPKDLYNPTQIEADGTESPEIRHPPNPSFPTLLRDGYHAPNFTTFGVESGISSNSNDKSNANPALYGDMNSSAYENIFSHGIDGIDATARRLYQAESNQNVHGSQTAPLPKHYSDNPVDTLYTKPQKPPGRQTEPILRPRPKGPAPAVPARRYTAPLSAGKIIIPIQPVSEADMKVPQMHSVTSKWQCKDCTYANPPTAAVCQMCSKSHTKRSEVVGPDVGGSQCDKCTLVNKPGALMCTACNSPLTNCPTFC